MEYHVTWSIDLNANSFDDAALLALEIQRDPNSIATHFQVKNKAGVERELSVSNRPKIKKNFKPHQQKGLPRLV